MPKSLDLLSCVGCHGLGFSRAGIDTITCAEASRPTCATDSATLKALHRR